MSGWRANAKKVVLKKIPDFDPLYKFQKDQKKMVRRHVKLGFEVDRVNKLLDCRGLSWDWNDCNGACYLCARSIRLAVISEGARLLAAQGGYCVHYIPKNWRKTSATLSTFDIKNAKKLIGKRLSKLPNHQCVLAVGAIDFSYNQRKNGKWYFQPHVHLVVAGATEAELTDAFSDGRLKETSRRRGGKKGGRGLLDVQPVDEKRGGLVGAIGYATKRGFVQRVPNTRKTNIKRKRLDYLEQYLMGISTKDRIILFGLRWRGRNLVKINHRKISP